jgi:hypothetical protein
LFDTTQRREVALRARCRRRLPRQIPANGAWRNIKAASDLRPANRLLCLRQLLDKFDALPPPLDLLPAQPVDADFRGAAVTLGLDDAIDRAPIQLEAPADFGFADSLVNKRENLKRTLTPRAGISRRRRQQLLHCESSPGFFNIFLTTHFGIRLRFPSPSTITISSSSMRRRTVESLIPKIRPNSATEYVSHIGSSRRRLRFIGSPSRSQEGNHGRRPGNLHGFQLVRWPGSLRPTGREICAAYLPS